MRSPLRSRALVLWARPLLAVLLGATALSAGCGPRRVPVEVVIGLTAPLSGSDAATGAAFVRGCERAAAEANAVGGVRLVPGVERSRVRLEVRDDRSETPEAEQLLDALAGAGVALSLATPDGVRAIAQAVVAERLERPLVVHPATSPGVPGPHMRWVFALPREVALPAGADPATRLREAEVEARAHATLTSVLAALGHAGGLDPVTVRAALQSAR